MSKHKVAISSMSLGRAYAHHSMAHKIGCASKAGFKGIEIFYEDLEYLARDQEPITAVDKQPTEAQILKAAELIRQSCDENDIEIIGLQPFLFYEGLKDDVEHQAMVTKLHLWFKIVKILGTDIIQIPTQFRRDDGVTGDIDRIVRDMLKVADLGLKETPPVKFAYENLAWGTFIDTVQGVWDVVSRVDRWNFGMCLDTFNIAGRVYADPATADGTTGPSAREDLEACAAWMVNTIDVKKIWYVQVVGAERLRHPLVAGHEWYVEGQSARMSWSRNARLFYAEDTQYIPIEVIAKAMLNPKDLGGLGFEGWISMELFSRTMNDESESVPMDHAKRGAVAWSRLVTDLGLL